MQRIVLPYRQTPFEAVSESPLDLQKARAGLRRGLSVGSLTSVVVVLVCIATASIVWVTYSSSHHRAEANRQVLAENEAISLYQDARVAAYNAGAGVAAFLPLREPKYAADVRAARLRIDSSLQALSQAAKNDDMP